MYGRRVIAQQLASQLLHEALHPLRVLREILLCGLHVVLQGPVPGRRALDLSPSLCLPLSLSLSSLGFRLPCPLRSNGT